MKVFISWSGDQSHAVAKAFYHFIGDCLQNVTPFLSSHNIDAGRNWPEVLRNELKTTGFGVLCLTPDNLTKPWLLFEAGAKVTELIAAKRSKHAELLTRPTRF